MSKVETARVTAPEAAVRETTPGHAVETISEKGAEPVAPATGTPVRSGEPARPGESGQRGESVRPGESGQPGGLAPPAEPDRPADPARSAEPARPAEPAPPGGVRAVGRVRAFRRLLGSELWLLFRRPRNLAALGVLALVPVLLGVAIRVSAPGEGEGPAILAQIAGNGLVLTFAAMFFLVPLLLPVAVAVVAGDAVAGEANSGTLRYLLTAPAGRTRLLAVKYVSVVVFAFAASLLVAVSALVTGLLLFPSGPMTLLSGVTVPFADGLLRALIMVGYVTVGMAALGAIGLAISTLTEAPIGAIAATATLVIVAQVLQSIPQLAAIQPFLLTSYWTDFDGALREPIATADMRTGLLVFAAYIAVFGSIAWARFTGRDVSS